MSTYLYDEALAEKLRKWTNDSSISIYSPDNMEQLLTVNAHETSDKPIKLPLITISRNGGYTVLNVNRKPMSFSGKTFDRANGKSLQVNAIPISIPYLVDIYTRHRKDADELCRNIIYNIINYPSLVIELPYNNSNRILEFSSNLILSPEVQDTSNIPQRMAIGQFTRLTLNLVIDDAYLFDARVRKVLTLNSTKEKEPVHTPENPGYGVGAGGIAVYEADEGRTYEDLLYKKEFKENG